MILPSPKLGECLEVVHRVRDRDRLGKFLPMSIALSTAHKTPQIQLGNTSGGHQHSILMPILSQQAHSVSFSSTVLP